MVITSSTVYGVVEVMAQGRGVAATAPFALPAAVENVHSFLIGVGESLPDGDPTGGRDCDAKIPGLVAADLHQRLREREEAVGQHLARVAVAEDGLRP